jgi:hypothetical protein
LGATIESERTTFLNQHCALALDPESNIASLDAQNRLTTVSAISRLLPAAKHTKARRPFRDVACAASDDFT